MKTLQATDVSELYKDEGECVLFLTTPLCGTCMVARKFLTIVDHMESMPPIGEVDINYIPELAQEWEVTSVPCLLVIKNGRPTKRLYAFQSVATVVEFLQEA
ncbi:thioredoxin family protein [Paenalkalicoccus suaedae]|uniref:Thioredoxin family protein n=1 Tax=Paenalkalicoccus suaedae TaxID=2592382 RepID=A0A859FEL4_9BACI|nr:thioredoxin family protein [Paenalkalicoccus suaedae]QKS71142.1 thioredoxin family protein [Paenalkalicoccus suaedae]